MYEDYEIFDKQVLLYPAKDFIFFQADIQGNYLTEKRLSCIKSMLDWEEFTLITTIDAFMDSIVPKQRFIESSIVIQKGEEIDSTLLSSKFFGVFFLMLCFNSNFLISVSVRSISI